jgi:hypothetical protein
MTFYILILEDLNFSVILQLLFCVLPKNYVEVCVTLPEYVILLYYYITTKVIFFHEGKNILHIRVVAWLGDPVHLVTTFVT